MKMKIKTKLRKRASPDGYMCFMLDGSSHAQRSIYSHERREQVHEVRKVGACLRCQLLKKSCSKGNPCTTCVRAAANTSASRSLAWMDCIRPSLLNVTIYGSSAHYDPGLHLGGVPVLQYLAHGDVDLKFDIPFQWNIDELSTFVAGWLINDHDAPRASMVGIMSSASLLSVISDLVGPELAQVFKALVYTSSLIFNSSNGRMMYTDKSTDVKILRHCGHRLLLHLESQTRPAALARLQRHELYALFLLLLGCIISSKYITESLGDLSRLTCISSGSATPQQIQSATTFHSDVDRGSELVRLLSHQMVYVGHSTGLIQDGVDKSLIQDLTSIKWHKKATFTWGAVDPFVQDETSFQGDRSQAHGGIHPKDQAIHCENTSTAVLGVADVLAVPDDNFLDSLQATSLTYNFKANDGESSQTSRRSSSVRTPDTDQMTWSFPPQVLDNESASDYSLLVQKYCFFSKEVDSGENAVTNIGSFGNERRRDSAHDDINGSNDELLPWQSQEAQDSHTFHKAQQLASRGQCRKVPMGFATIRSCQPASQLIALEDKPFHEYGDWIPGGDQIFQRLPPQQQAFHWWQPGSRGETPSSHEIAFGPPFESHSVDCPTPMDYSMASPDPNLPTLDLDMDFLPAESANLWPCLNRVPTPPPDPNVELEQQMEEFESLQWTSRQHDSSRARQGPVDECKQMRLTYDNRLIEMPRKRLLL